MENSKKHIYMFVIAIITMLYIFAYDKIMVVLKVFSPVLYGALIAYLMDGMVRLCDRWFKMKRGVAIAIVVVFVLFFCGITFYYTIPFLANTIKDLFTYVSTLISEHNTGLYNMFESISQWLNIDFNAIYKLDLSKIDKNILDVINNAVQGVYGITVGTVTKVGSSLVVFFTSFVLAVYMLIEKYDLLLRMKRLVASISSEKNEAYVLNSLRMANDVFKKFLIGKAVDSLIVGVIMIMLFLLFGIEYGVVFGLLGGIGNMIPYFGPIISAVPVVIILLIINPWHALIALIIILVVQQLDAHIIGPKVLSENIGGASAFWILFSVTVCGMAFGFIGMIFGVPIVIIIKNLAEDFVANRLSKRKNSVIAKEELLIRQAKSKPKKQKEEPENAEEQ